MTQLEKYDDYHIYKNLIISYSGVDEDIVIPEGIEFIGRDAFKNCISIKTVVIPSSVRCIDDMSFMGCTELRSVTLGSSTNKVDDNTEMRIGESAFTNCPLETIHVYVNHIVTGGYHTLAYPFRSDSDGHTANLFIHDSVKKIRGQVFAEFKRLKNVYFGKNLEYIGIHSFLECTSIEEIIIPDSVRLIDNGAFLHCSGVRSITIGTGNSSSSDDIKLESNSFNVASGYTCKTPSNLERIIINKYVHNSELTFEINIKSPFLRSKSKYDISLTIGDNVGYIGSYMFSGMSSLTSVHIGSSIELIPKNAFKDSPNLRNVTLCPNLKMIGHYAFSGCPNLKDIHIPNTLNCERIDTLAFEGSSVSIFYEGDEDRWNEVNGEFDERDMHSDILLQIYPNLYQSPKKLMVTNNKYLKVMYNCTKEMYETIKKI